MLQQRHQHNLRLHAVRLRPQTRDFSPEISDALSRRAHQRSAAFFINLISWLVCLAAVASLYLADGASMGSIALLFSAGTALVSISFALVASDLRSIALEISLANGEPEPPWETRQSVLVVLALICGFVTLGLLLLAIGWPIGCALVAVVSALRPGPPSPCEPPPRLGNLSCGCSQGEVAATYVAAVWLTNAWHLFQHSGDAGALLAGGGGGGFDGGEAGGDAPPGKSSARLCCYHSLSGILFSMVGPFACRWSITIVCRYS